MNLQNLYLLKGVLQQSGFDDYSLLHEQLEQAISRGAMAFQLYTDSYYDDCKLEAELFFRRLPDQDAFAFVNYHCLLRYTSDPTKDVSQTFFTRDGRNVTFKEAFNLLQGRAVNKNIRSFSGESFNAWICLNFHEKDNRGDYKFLYYQTKHRYIIDQVLELYPIQELNNGDTKQALIQSLKAGDRCLVTLDKARKNEKMYIEANPRNKSINIFPVNSSFQKL